MKNTAIRTEHLTKENSGVKAVKDLNLEIYEGELFALLGVNGAGKTTTIRMLTGLSTPSDGNASIFGKDIRRNLDEVQTMVGVSTQDTAVADNLTVEENLKFTAGVYFRSKQFKENIAEISIWFALSNNIHIVCYCRKLQMF